MMENVMDLEKFSDEELIVKYTVEVNGRKFVPSKVLDYIGKRHAKLADRKPGDPGTKENPIFKDGHAYVYSSADKLIIWEDYTGLIPVGNGITVNINPETMEAFTLTREMKPSESQKEMIKKAKSRPVVFTADSPKSSPEQLERFKTNGKAKIMRMAELRT